MYPTKRPQMYDQYSNVVRGVAKPAIFISARKTRRIEPVRRDHGNGSDTTPLIRWKYRYIMR